MMNPVNPNIVNPVAGAVVKAEPASKTTAASLSFGQVLEANLVKSGELKFSAHAQSRIFVVSVKNNTVITAVDASSMKGNVFTNIDSAVIV